MKIEEFKKLDPVSKKAILIQTEIAKKFLLMSFIFIMQMFSLYSYLNGGHWGYIVFAALCVFWLFLNAFYILIDFAGLVTLHTTKNSMELSLMTLETLVKGKEEDKE